MSTESADDFGDQSESPGAALARMRRRARLTGQQLGQMTAMSQAKISRIETGQTTVSPEDVARLARALGASRDVVDRLVVQAERVGNRMTDWRQAAGSVGGIQSEVAGLEALGKEFRIFQPSVIVDLVQTSEYARAVLSSIDAFYGRRRLEEHRPSVAGALAARVGRQAILAEPGRRFNFIVGEAALSGRVAEPLHMWGQIDRLRQVARQDNVDLRIIPADATLPFPLIHGFELIDATCVCIDVFNTAMMSRGSEDVASYRQVFDVLERVATDDIGPLLEKYQRHYRDLVV